MNKIKITRSPIQLMGVVMKELRKTDAVGISKEIETELKSNGFILRHFRNEEQIIDGIADTNFLGEVRDRFQILTDDGNGMFFCIPSNTRYWQITFRGGSRLVAWKDY